MLDDPPSLTDACVVQGRRRILLGVGQGGQVIEDTDQDREVCEMPASPVVAHNSSWITFFPALSARL